MSTLTLSPGVYRRPAIASRPPGLATGVPGFVGFADAGIDRWTPLSSFGDFQAKVVVANGASFLSQVVQGFFDNGGQSCYVAGAGAGSADPVGALAAALALFEQARDIDLVACPDAVTLRAADGTIDLAAMLNAQRMLLAHAAANRRFALLDAAQGSSTAMVLAQRAAVTLGASEPFDGALYYPWVKNDDGALTPPSGHIAGVIALTDATDGVARAPAGMEITGVLDVEVGIDAAAQAPLNDAGVNCLRAFPGRGVRVWGARTLSRDPDWTYINVRRLFLTLSRWIEANLGWTVFEPNSPTTWARVERVLTAYLTELWRANALTGAKADQAFFVRCDASTNPPAGRDAGGMVVEIGLAPSVPAEFITVRFDLASQAT